MTMREAVARFIPDGASVCMGTALEAAIPSVRPGQVPGADTGAYRTVAADDVAVDRFLIRPLRAVARRISSRGC